jgi:hypothetical protein
MLNYFSFVSGVIICIIAIKILLPNPKHIKIYPNVNNYKNITYVDENGILYKYELTKVD